MSCSIVTPPTIAIIANTIDAAPLRPAHDTTRYCEIFVLNGASTVATANGLAMNVINSAINIDGYKTVNIFDGNDKSPKRKNISICISPVIPSKKCTSDFLLCMF